MNLVKSHDCYQYATNSTEIPCVKVLSYISAGHSKVPSNFKGKLFLHCLYIFAYPMDHTYIRLILELTNTLVLYLSRRWCMQNIDHSTLCHTG